MNYNKGNAIMLDAVKMDEDNILKKPAANYNWYNIYNIWVGPSRGRNYEKSSYKNKRRI